MQLFQIGLVLTTAALVPFGQARALHQRNGEIMTPETPAAGNATAPEAHTKRTEILAGTCQNHKGYPSGVCVALEPNKDHFQPMKEMRCGEGRYQACQKPGTNCWWDADDDDTPAICTEQ
ncbi:hypothetical protein PG993_012537 [Apiospora rasikravindrae]|uniref:Uncharacterized protein n=1 Tax=Apiospora rasikravindrae TaxID=990691 RepID=A0ABR1S4H8_9PEZI